MAVNLNELGELMSEAVAKQDFVSAAEIKEKIGILEVSKEALVEEMSPKPVVLPSQVLPLGACVWYYFIAASNIFQSDEIEDHTLGYVWTPQTQRKSS